MSNQVKQSQMLSVRVKKLWQGRYVSVRDSIVEKAVAQGGMIIRHEDKVMQITADELKTLKPQPEVFQSKFKGTYQLIDVPWKPLTDDPNQGAFNV